MFEEMLLQMKSITKTFPGVMALENVHFDLKKGEVHALLGENGAGKSTLIKILAGIYCMDTGEILIDGVKKCIENVNNAKELGISVIHQEISLVPKLSVANNIMLGTEGKKIFLNFKQRFEKADKAMKELDFDINVGARVDTLSIAQQQIVEIVRALSTNNAKIIVMDEPTASISEKDAEKLFKTIEKLKENGIGIIYISHRMEEVMKIADRITVFRDGKYIDTKYVKDTKLSEIVEMMVGRQIEEMYHYNIKTVGDIVLEMKNISNNNLKNVNFELRKGEVHGLYGLIGSGRTELAQVLFGIDEYKGEIKLNGKVIHLTKTKDAMKNGIALVPEDRKTEGLILSNTIKFNSTITVLEKYMKYLRIIKIKANEILDKYKSKLKIKYNTTLQCVGNLSGGNQQKIVLSKWLATKPEILILDEPTKGIDIGAKSEIYNLIFELIAEGVSIILISSELPQIINLCTRVSVMREGRVVGTIERKSFKQEKIFEYAMQ